MKQLIKILGLTVFLFALANCNNKSSNDQATTYKWQNGLCYSNLNRQVDNSNCNGLINSNSNYYFANGQCIDRTTSYPVQPTLCQTTTGVGGSQQCVGLYKYLQPMTGQIVDVMCGAYNPPTSWDCRGQTLISPQTNQQVTCI